MPLYEHTFLARQEISAQAAEGLAQTFKDILKDNGGSVGKTEYWGIRPLAYNINKNRKAHYIFMNIDAPHAALHEMERQMRLNANVLRYLTIRVDALEEGPSAMMQKRDRDERRGGSRGGPRGDKRGNTTPSRKGPPVANTSEDAKSSESATS